jgi:hypothetical protein
MGERVSCCPNEPQAPVSIAARSGEPEAALDGREIRQPAEERRLMARRL